VTGVGSNFGGFRDLEYHILDGGSGKKADEKLSEAYYLFHSPFASSVKQASSLAHKRSFKTLTLLRERSSAMPNRPVVNLQYGSFKLWNDIVKHKYFIQTPIFSGVQTDVDSAGHHVQVLHNNIKWHKMDTRFVVDQLPPIPEFIFRTIC
jgi:hypothetical protein